MSQNSADRFDTAGLRAAVLDAWRASPTRYREDANVEDDYSLGAYHDRLIVELAQNAVDAARAAGVPARLRVSFETDRLVVANTGAPLDRSGVESLASMRASAKSAEGSVGRFGVGFAAVLDVTDAPAIVSRHGGVRFSRADTAALLRDDPALAAHLAEREPPALRLPFPSDGADSDWDGYDTLVVLPWRDTSARARVEAAVRAIDDALFVALPELAELDVVGAPDDVTARWTATTESNWVTVTADDAEARWARHDTWGEWTDAQLAEAPAEQRDRRRWQVTWAVPLTSSGTPARWVGSDRRWPARVLHAPTPTDEPLRLPALLVGSFPVDPSRRRQSPGPMTDVMLAAAVDAYGGLVAEHAGRVGASAAVLVPEADLVGELDGRLRADIRERLGATRWVPRAADGSAARPSDLVALEPPAPDLVRVLAPHVNDLLAPEWLPEVGVLRGLGLASRGWAEVWDVVAGLPLPPETWFEVYGAATELDRTSLEGLPVPLADGRVVRDARTCVLPDGESSADDLRALELPVVAAAAVHPLLERLGAQAFDPRLHLATLPLRVQASMDDDPDVARGLLEVAAAVLARAGTAPGELTGLGETPVPTETGDWLPAAQVVMPRSPLAVASAAAAGVLLDPSLADHDQDGWLALGVLGELTVVPLHDVPMDPEQWDAQMVDGGDWCLDTAQLLDGRSPSELLVVSTSVVRGIELLEDGPLASVVELLSEPAVRAAIVEPTTVLDGQGRARSVPAPGAWWLSMSPLSDGRTPPSLRLPGDERLAPFHDLVDLPGEPDIGLLEAIGIHTTLESWLEHPDGPSELLSAMADPDTELPDALVPQLYEALGRSVTEPDSVDLPGRVTALVSGAWRLVDATDVLIAVAPHHAYVLKGPFIPGGHELADVLDIDVSDDAACGAEGVAGSGDRRDVPASVAGHVRVDHYWEHDALTVGGRAVDWWVTDGSEVHACTLDGLASALAWADRRWQRRWELAARLTGDSAGRGVLDSYYDSYDDSDD